MNRAKKMHEACRRRIEETNGECESYDCYFLGWCSYVYDAVGSKKKKESPNGEEKEGTANETQ